MQQHPGEAIQTYGGGYGPPPGGGGGYGPPPGGGGYGPPPGGGYGAPPGAPGGFGPPGGGYGAPPGGYGPPPGFGPMGPMGPMGPGYPAPSSGLAIASLITGIIAIPGMCCCYSSLPLGIAAVVTGMIHMSKLKAEPMRYTGRGMAIAGVVCGAIGVLLTLALMIFGMSMQQYSPYYRNHL